MKVSSWICLLTSWSIHWTATCFINLVLSRYFWAMLISCGELITTHPSINASSEYSPEYLAAKFPPMETPAKYNLAFLKVFFIHIRISWISDHLVQLKFEPAIKRVSAKPLLLAMQVLHPNFLFTISQNLLQ